MENNYIVSSTRKILGGMFEPEEAYEFELDDNL
jgi:hypothetical protein